MFKVNPYRPGAGLMPVYIAGRDEDIQNVSQMFDALTMDIPTQSIIFSGLRGVGKTVLINKLQSIAEEKGIFCKHVIELSDVENCIDEFLSSLDERFFKSRYERCAESDKKFIFAMVECGELPCTISNVAHNLNKTVGSISTTRAQLISKGIIYPVRYKELDFTVPEFSGYIQRLEEYKQWCVSK